VCLSCGVQVASAARCTTTRIVTEVGDLVQRIENCHTDRVLGGQTIERSDGIVCGLHRARGGEEREFLG
jgi:hypothetical protein